MSIRAIEDETAIGFLYELPNDIENVIESEVWEMWPTHRAISEGKFDVFAWEKVAQAYPLRKRIFYGPNVAKGE